MDKSSKSRTRSEAFSSSSTEDSCEFKKSKFSTSITDTSIDEMSNADLLEEFDKKLKIHEDVIIEKISKMFDNVLEMLTERMLKTEKKTGELDDRVKLLEVKLKDKDRETVQLKEELIYCRRNTIRTEQYSRRNNLKILGLEDKQPETNKQQVINFVRSELSYNIDENDVVSAHRIKGKSDKYPNPIIVQVSNMQIRKEILSRRKTLKGSNCIIFEDCCQEQLSLMHEVKQNSIVAKTWISDGKVFAVDKRGRKIKMEWGQNVTETFANLPVSW